MLDEKGHSVHLTDRGVEFLSPSDHDAFVLPDISARQSTGSTTITSSTAEEKIAARRELEIDYAAKSERLNIVHQLLRAHALYEKDVNYVVQDGEVLIVDEFTGRTMPGRRWSEGLHQAVEAKEGVRVKGETQTMATITIQNYFRMYEKLAGMTGTAETEEAEFFQIYKLEVAVIPTNKPMIRDDRHDLVYKTRREKYNAIVEETRRLHGLGYPGADRHHQRGRVRRRCRSCCSAAACMHNVLNAKYHQREAEIVADAGQPGAITIATNMAGRGTDIKLGAGVTESKPSEREGSRRQGRSTCRRWAGCTSSARSATSRGASTGSCAAAPAARAIRARSQFFLSLEDDLMRLFGSATASRKLMDRMGAQEGEVLTHPLITRSIEQAQKRVELQNFQSRKRLLEYDDVMNQQREVIYSLRAFALEGGEELKGEALKMVEKALGRRVETVLAEYDDAGGVGSRPAAAGAADALHDAGPSSLADPELRPTTSSRRRNEAVEAATRRVRREDRDAGRDPRRRGRATATGCCRYVMLNVLDEKWKDHLYDLDQLRNAIHYRSWGQKDPLLEYKQEAYTMFVDLMNDIAKTFTERFLKVQLVVEQGPPSDGRGGFARRAAGDRRRRRGGTTRSACSRTSCRRQPVGEPASTR